METSEPRRLLAERLHGTSLYLVGMMGSGKSTIGRHLAQRLRYQFFDTDHLIESAMGQGIPQIFAQSGEAAFRELETQTLVNLSPYSRLVVATGGGIVQRSVNWGHLRHGVVIWLDVALPVLLSRLEKDETRPLLQVKDPAATLRALVEERRPLYAQADVHVRIEASVGVITVVDWIEAQVMRRLRDPDARPGSTRED